MILQNALLFTKSGFQIVAIFDQMPNSYQNNLKNYYASFTRTSSIQRVCILALCTITLVSILLYIHIHLTHRITTAKKTLETISLQQNASTPNLKEQYDVLIAHHADVANCSKLNTLLYQGILTIIDALPKNTSLHALTSTSQIKNQNTSNKKFTIAILGTSINEKEINTLIQNLEISEKFKNLTFIQLKQEASTHPFYSFELSCFL
ncbi:MAG TPA: PilN domain-containing protein [Candidatus Babeliales bacterium]|nr:PilN domain-containing protein [Candidatus Babeliales bacterium]